ncbi:MAG: hypothetical protein ACREPR_10125 [Brasilonema sp.]
MQAEGYPSGNPPPVLSARGNHPLDDWGVGRAAELADDCEPQIEAMTQFYGVNIVLSAA